jgi:hypothetical protein
LADVIFVVSQESKGGHNIMTGKKYNYILSAVMITLSAYIFITANKFPKTGIDQGFGAGVFPILLSAVIFFCAAIILLQTIFDKTENKKIDDLSLKNLKKPLVFWFFLITFCVLFKIIGFLADAFIYMMLASVILFRVKLWKAFLVSILVPALIWCVFSVVMHVPLPFGIIWVKLGLGG